MNKMNDVYSKYNLASSEFDESLWRSEWGDRLEDAGFTKIAKDIVLEANTRRFLSSNLTAAELIEISEKEDLISAVAAEDFRKRVAAVSIVESYEPLVDLRKTPETINNTWTFTKNQYHEACGEWAGLEKLFLVRSSMADRLSELASKLLLIDTKIHFEDGFRPFGVQEGLFTRRIKMVREAHPNWSSEQILLEAKSKTAFTPRFAAHKAGAAVDVSIYSSVSGEFYNIGQRYPDGGELVRQNTEFVTQIQWQNRKILEYVARSCGLVMYPFENWHLCHGDATASVVSANTSLPIAQFGPIKNYNPDTGEITNVYSPEELDSVFLINCET